MLETLAAGIAELRDIDPSRLTGTTLNQLIVQAEGLLNQLNAAVTDKISAWEQRGGWESDQAKSPAAWLTWQTGKPNTETRRQVRLAQALPHMPAAAAAWANGDITDAHVQVLTGIRTPATVEVFERDEKLLVDQARTMSFKLFTKAAQYWHQLADPDGPEDRAAKQHQARRFNLSQTVDGIWYGSFQLDPIAGTIVNNALTALEQTLYRAEKATTGITLTATQRRADALVQMARHARTVTKGDVARAPLFTVLVDYPTLAGRVCELANGTVITPGQLIPWLDQAYVERVVFDPTSCVVDVGERRRFFTGATRRAVEVRDQGCFHPTCEEPMDRCQIDHIKPWSKQGPTIRDNGQQGCGYHNRTKSDTDPDPPPP